MPLVRTSDLIDGVEVKPQPAFTMPPRPVTSLPITGNQFASILAWCGASFTTYLFVTSLQPDLVWYIAAIAALAIQYIFTRSERSLMYGKASKYTFAVFAVDAIINAAGIWPYLRNIGSSTPAQMFAAAGLDTSVGSLSGILLALLFGAIIAVAPEALWKAR